MHPSRTDIIVYRKAKLRIVENALVASKLAIFSETTLGLPYPPFQSLPYPPSPKSIPDLYQQTGVLWHPDQNFTHPWGFVAREAPLLTITSSKTNRKQGQLIKQADVLTGYDFQDNMNLNMTSLFRLLSDIFVKLQPKSSIESQEIFLRKVKVVYHQHRQTGQFTVWANGKQNSELFYFVPESRLPFVQILSIYRKTAAKA